jgi:mannose/cellobiose epimerase-like protein (N-acyl-D-glucosamine 2-epimerase family)
MNVDFTFSDLIAGYVKKYDQATDSFDIETSDGRPFTIKFGVNCYGELLRNLGEPFHDCTGQMREMLAPGRFLYAYGIFFPDNGSSFEAKHVVYVGRTENEYLFEKQDWWIKQVRSLADFYLKVQFPDGVIDYRNYRTNITLTGEKMSVTRQECDTISRLVYGFASAYLMTGNEKYLEAAEKGTAYLRDHFRFLDKSEGICYWYHGIDIKSNGSEHKVFASEFGDDYDAIPAYEQIYALAGPTQTYRITGDPAIMADIDYTLNLFNKYFLDTSERGGYYSHVDPITLSPTSESLGRNRARKNWNSVGDHAPAYLINLWLASGREDHAEMLERTFDTIAAHFPDYDHSPFVQEKFNDDWSHDKTWGWQQDRAVVGHNLKIAWNLMRMYSLKPKKEYVELAEKIAALMPKAGGDPQRGGWYDVVERALKPGETIHRFAWHDRKAWWQQEQGILAYFILAGILGKDEYRKLARESAAFYNAWFLDNDSGGVYFNVLANGIPYLLGTERGKGSHSMSGYHSFELAYLSAVYTNLLVTKEPLDLYFKPKPSGFKDNVLRVAPDILPPGSIKIAEVWVDGKQYSDFDADKCEVRLPADHTGVSVKVRVMNAAAIFDAHLLEVTNGTARIYMSGALTAHNLGYLQEVVEDARGQNAERMTLLMGDLKEISSEGLRYLIMQKQKMGANEEITVVGAQGSVKQAIEDSEFGEEISLVQAESAKA